MKLANRIQKLERTKALAGSALLIEQLQRAINRGAEEAFIRGLTDEDLETLGAAMERIAFGDDREALEAAKRKVLGELAAEPANTTPEPEGW